MTMIDPTTGQPVQQPPPPAPQQQPFVVQLPPQPAPQPPTQTLSFEDAMKLVEAARKEEKEKLYPQIEELKKTASDYEREKREREEATAAEQARIEEEQRRVAEERMSAQELIAQTNATWEERFNQLQADRDREAALRAKEAELFQLAQYRQERIAAESDNIEPRFLDFVNGNTREEIDQSIERVKQKTAEIMNDIQAANQGQRRQLGLPPTSGPPVDMAALTDPSNQRQLSADDIKNMDLNEYSQLRSQLLGAAGSRVQQQGLYAP